MPNREEELAAKLESVRKITKENPEVDEKRLVEGLLLQDKTDYLPANLKTRAYIISLLFPPFGLYYVIKFYFREEKDAKKVAFICLGITGLTFILGLVIANAVFSSVPEIDQVFRNRALQFDKKNLYQRRAPNHRLLTLPYGRTLLTLLLLECRQKYFLIHF